MQQPFPAAPVPNQQLAKLHISDIHESVTEEMLWKKFKQYGTIHKIKVARDRETQQSKRYAKITFTNQENAKKALEELNFTKLLQSEFLQKEKIIRISKDIEMNKLALLKKHNVFISGIPPLATPKEIYNILTQYGDILSLYITTKKDNKTNAGYGFVLYETETDNQKLIEKIKSCKLQDGSEIHFSSFIAPENREHNYKKNFYIKDFCTETLTEDEMNDEELRKQKLDQAKSFLQKNVSQCGEIDSIITNVDRSSKKIFAFVTFKKESDSDNFETDGKNYVPEGTYINLQKQKAVSGIDEKVLVIKSLKPDIDESEFISVVNSIGKVQSSNFQKKDKDDKIKNSIEAKLCHIGFIDGQNSEKFLYTYLQNKDLKQYFVNENPNGQVTIHLPAKERIKIRRQNEQHFKNQPTIQQTMQQGQYMQHPNVPYMRIAEFNRPKNMFPFPGQQQRQQQGGFQRNNNMRKQQSAGQPQRKTQQPQQPPRQTQSQQPKQVQPQPVQKPSIHLTIESLKKNLNSFLSLSQKEQSQILGNLIYPQVQALSKELNFPEVQAPKITGMLIDFSVFEVQDILENIENKDELKERVVEAVSLINEQENNY